MKIAVLIPSEEYRNLAGARIRYGRISGPLAAAGHTLELENITKFNPRDSDYDVHIISKCHDAQALMCAQILTSAGKFVGVDLFDDYFSQRTESRLSRFRTWLAVLINSVDFALCSTPKMAAIAQTYRSAIRCHVMNDPAPVTDAGYVVAALEGKLQNALASRILPIGWYGVGDNPYFNVGSSDLAAFGATLAHLANAGWQPRLSILTNVRAMTPASLVKLGRLPIPFTIGEWSEAKEADLLAESIMCMLPVNAQNFSIAKSLNRAVSALTAGCQVVSNAFPLYQPLADLVYRDIDSFAVDLARGQLKLAPATMDRWAQMMSTFASPEKEAQDLLAFLSMLSVDRVTGMAPNPIALVHGTTVNGQAQKMAKRVGALSIGSPFCMPHVKFDALFRYSPRDGRVLLFVADKLLPQLTVGTRARAKPFGKIGEVKYSVLGSPEAANLCADTMISALPMQIALYGNVVSDMRRQLADAFGEMTVIISEMAAMPLNTEPADSLLRAPH